MSNELILWFPVYGGLIALLFIIGLYCVIVTHNAIRLLIGLEILTKAVTLSIIMAGYITGRPALGQALAITLIVIEVVVVAVAAGIVLGVFKHNRSLDLSALRQLKG